MHPRPADRLQITTVASPVGPRGGTSVAAMLLSLGLAAAIAQAQAPAAPAAQAAPAAAPAPDAQALKALFIEVNGKVQWRSGPDQPWQNAKVDDVVTSGAEVRTGLKSFAALRVGDNATALIDAGTMFQMPSVVKDGDTLRTTVSVKSGRADFKVDKVGLTNDFKVVTPSTTLAVRGTEFAVASGALKNVEVLGARANTINAIELKYALNNTTVRMSGAAASSSNLKQPTHNAVVATASPATAGALPSTNSTETVANAAVGPSPANAGSPAEAQQSNNAAAKTQTAVSREQTNTDGDSLAARIARAIKDAKTRVDRAIAYLLAMDGELAKLEDQRIALDALEDLAVAKRAEARLALLQNRVALEGQDGQGGILGKLEQAASHETEFNRLAELIDVQLADFESQKATAGLEPAVAPARDRGLVAMERFAADGAAEQPGPPQGDSRWAADADVNGTADVVDDMTAVHGALVAMGGHFEDARASMIGMADAIIAVDGLLDAIEAGELPASRAAIASFHAAVAALEGYAGADTTSAVNLATAARDAASALKAIIDGADVVGSSPTQELLEKAAEAVAKLDAAQAGLLQVSQAAQAVKDIRDGFVAERASDPRVALLGRVEEIYDEMVAMHVAMLAQWAALNAPAEGDEPAGRFAAAEAAMHALLGTKGAGQAPRTAGRAEEAFDGIAELARDRAEQAAARAEAVIAPVSGQDPPRSADQVAYDAAVAAVDAAVEDSSRPVVLADAQSRTQDAADIADLAIDLSNAIVAHAARIDGAQVTSALEPLYRAVPVAVTRTVDFENTPGVAGAPPANTSSETGVDGASNLASSSYAGFTWSGQSWAFRKDPQQDNGFTNGVRSGTQGAFNNAQGAFFLLRSEEWTPESAWFTGAWNTGLVITLTGTRDGVELEPVSFTLGAPTGPQQVSLRALGLADITSVRITSSGGERYEGFPGGGSGEMFVMDDLSWSRIEAPASRADWTVTYDASARASQLAAIADAAGALDGEGGPAAGGIYAAIQALADQEAAIRQLEDSGAWEARIQDVLARGRDALQSALEAADGAAASERSIEAEDLEAKRILAVAATLHELAAELETAFGGEFGFSAGADADSSGTEDRLERTQAAADATAAALSAAAALRAQADQLAQGNAAELGPDLEAWAAQVRTALTANPVAAGTLSAIVGRIDSALDTYRLRATDATEVFAEYASSAADAAATAAAAAGDAASPIAGVEAPVAVLRDLQQVSDDAERSTERIATLVGGSAARAIDGTPIGQKFAEAATGLDALDGQDGSTLGTRTQADDVVAQLDALHEALVGVLGAQGIDVSELVRDVTVGGIDGRLSSLRDAADVGDEAGEPGLVTLAGRVATQVQDGRPGIESASQVAVAAADDARDAADRSAAAAQRLSAIAVALEAQYGSDRIDGGEVAANAADARVAADDAAARHSAASSAHAAMVAQFDSIQADVDADPQVGTWAEWVASVGARADALLVAARSALSGPGGASTDAAAIASQLAQYSEVNARGSQVFAGLTAGAADAVLARLQAVNGGQEWASDDLARYGALSSSSSSIAAASDALAGAEGAADRADTAAAQAESLRGVAEARESDAHRGLQLTQAERTAGNRDYTVTASVLSRAAADLSAVRRDQAGAEVQVADAYQNGTPAVAALRAAWRDETTGAAAYAAFKNEVTGHESALVQADIDVNGARSQGVPFDRDSVADGSLRAQVDFYDSVVQTLAGRIDGARADEAALAAAASGNSEAVRALAISAARHLAVQANAAQTMATQARTNADRFFGRAMVDYVARAQSAYDRAIVSASAAGQAATRAEGHADAARDLVPVAGQLASGPSAGN